VSWKSTENLLCWICRHLPRYIIEYDTVTATAVGDGEKSREQRGNTAVMGFRTIGNTAEIKLINATDVATGEALPYKTA